MVKVANLTQHDTLSILVAALCHDFKHDGFNNSYHINAQTSRAIAFNDVSVQENFHISETFKVLYLDENNFISHFSVEQKKHFRKRVIESILATDMVYHMPKLNWLKGQIEKHSIIGGENASLILDYTTSVTLFNSQQELISNALHAADISSMTRPFEIG